MDAKVILEKFLPPEGSVPVGAQSSWPLVIRAKGRDIPDEIFVYQLGDADTEDRFSCVASYPQMVELPKSRGAAVDPFWAVPFYRRAEMRVICRNPAEVDQVWKLAQAHAQALVENWNAAWLLKGVERVQIDDQTVSVESIVMNAPTLVYLDYRPAGTATYVDDVQGIDEADASLSGWLPVSAASPGWIVPSGAVFFYNLAQDSNLSALWPLPEPVSGQSLLRNGIQLPYGITHVIDAHAIWWLDFDPANLPGYERLSGQPADSAAPWPVDYVDRQNPGAVSPQLTLTVFGE